MYFAATSLYDGPNTFLSTLWQAKQPLFCANADASAAFTCAATNNEPAAAIANNNAFMISPCVDTYIIINAFFTTSYDTYNYNL